MQRHRDTIQCVTKLIMRVTAVAQKATVSVHHLASVPRLSGSQCLQKYEFNLLLAVSWLLDI